VVGTKVVNGKGCVVRVGVAVRGVEIDGLVEVYNVVGRGREDCGGGTSVRREDVLVEVGVVEGSDVDDGGSSISGSTNVDEGFGATEEEMEAVETVEDVCDECVARETGKDCENRGEEAGRLDERYEVSKVVPPDIVLGEEFTEELPVDSSEKYEFDTDVGLVAKDILPTDVTLPTVLLGDDFTPVVSNPKENESEKVMGKVGEGRSTDLALPVDPEDVERAIVLGSEYIEVLSPDNAKENEYENLVGVVKEGPPADVVLPVVW
jgi:hypothetical protein